MKQQKFLNCINDLILDGVIQDKEIITYFYDVVSKAGEKQEKKITEKGLAVLSFLQNSEKTEFKAKDIAEEMGISARSISGTMLSLCNSGYVNKTKYPVENVYTYSLSEKGKEFKLD